MALPASAQETARSAFDLRQLDAHAACTYTKVQVSRSDTDPSASPAEDVASNAASSKDMRLDRVSCVIQRILQVSHQASEVTGGSGALGYITVREKRSTQHVRRGESALQTHPAPAKEVLQTVEKRSVNEPGAGDPGTPRDGRGRGEAVSEKVSPRSSPAPFDSAEATQERPARIYFGNLERFDPQKGNGNFYTGVSWLVSLVTGEAD